MAKPDLSEFFRIKRCAVGSLNLTDEQREKLNAALEHSHDDISNVDIMRVLKQWGFSVKKTTLSEHRRNVCCCD